MVIQIERISAQNIQRSAHRCSEPQCAATATWLLADSCGPELHPNIAERACCIEHITVTYLSLRGAHLIARNLLPARAIAGAQSGERRRRKRRSIATGGHTHERGSR